MVAAALKGFSLHGTLSIVLARAVRARVNDLGFAVFALPSLGAGALVVVEFVVASGTILAGFARADINIGFTVLASPSICALARVRIDAVVANAAILAGFARAIVNLSSLIVPDRRQGGNLVLDLSYQVALFREARETSLALIGLGLRFHFLILASI